MILVGMKNLFSLKKFSFIVLTGIVFSLLAIPVNALESTVTLNDLNVTIGSSNTTIDYSDDDVNFKGVSGTTTLTVPKASVEAVVNFYLDVLEKTEVTLTFWSGSYLRSGISTLSPSWDSSTLEITLFKKDDTTEIITVDLENVNRYINLVNVSFQKFSVTLDLNEVNAISWENTGSFSYSSSSSKTYYDYVGMENFTISYDEGETDIEQILSVVNNINITLNFLNNKVDNITSSTTNIEQSVSNVEYILEQIRTENNTYYSQITEKSENDTVLVGNLQLKYDNIVSQLEQYSESLEELKDNRPAIDDVNFNVDFSQCTEKYGEVFQALFTSDIITIILAALTLATLSFVIFGKSG